MSSDGACSQFQQHVWKPDVCAGCLKPKLSHTCAEGAGRARPTPAKRQTKETVTSAKSLSGDQGSLELKSHAGTISSSGIDDQIGTAATPAKPSPLKAKPAIGSKPVMSQKPVTSGKDCSHPLPNTDSKTDTVIINGDDGMSKEESMERNKDHTLIGFSSKSSVLDNIIDNGIMSNANAVGKANAEVRSSPGKTASENRTCHIYQVYDIAARSSAGDQLLPSKSEGEDYESENTGKGLMSSMKLVKVEEDQVAIPYNVVDVTIRRPKASDCLPQLPLTPAPVHNCGNTWPAAGRHHGPSKDVHAEGSPKPRQMTSKPTNCSVNFCEQSRVSELKGTSSPEHGFDRYAHRIYEDIDEDGSLSSDKVAVQPAIRGSVAKSAAFEAKLAALSSLDLGKPSASKPAAVGSAGEEQSDDGSKPEAAEMKTGSPIKKPVALPEQTKPDKARKKEGGRSFLQKLLKIGSKDGTKESKDSVSVSSDPDTHETLDNPVVTAEVVGESLNTSSESCPDASVPSSSVKRNPAALPETQAVLLNLKDCLAKRQTNVATDGSENDVTFSQDVCQEMMENSCGLNAANDNMRHDPQSAADVEQIVDAPDSSSVEPKLKPVPRTVLAKPAVMQVADGELGTGTQLTSNTRQQQKPREESAGLHAQGSDVAALTVVTDNCLVTDSLVSPCSLSDATSPTPSDPGSDGADCSFRRRSRVDQKLSKEVRKTLGAPPPPPPSSPAAGFDSGSSQSSSPYTPPTSVVDGAEKHPLAPLSHSLPRPASRRTQNDTSRLGDPVVRRFDSPSKHSRNKTVSEGIKLEDQTLAAGAEDNRTDEERLMELVEKRASKFLNRALPDPPAAPLVMQHLPERSHSCPQTSDDMYELVATQDSGAPSSSSATCAQTYEDIDAVCDIGSSSDGSHNKESPRQLSKSLPPARQSCTRTKPAVVVDEEYLEPVLPLKNETNSANWRPSPAPRSLTPSSQEPAKSQTTYMNCESPNASSLSCLFPLTVGDCLEMMDKIIQGMLKQLSDSMYASLLPQTPSSGVNWNWSEFELVDGVAQYLTQKHIYFYKAKHQLLHSTGCILMVMTIKPAKPLSQHRHPNVVSPIGALRASNLIQSDDADADFDNVAVLPFVSVMRFDEYWRTRHRRVMAGNLQAAVVEREICLCLAYVLDAALHLHNRGWSKPRVDWNHVVMASKTESADGSLVPMLRPSTKSSETRTSGSGEKCSVYSDVYQLIAIMLEPDVVEVDSDPATNPAFFMSEPDEGAPKLIVRRVDIKTLLTADSPYSRCLQRILRSVQQHQESSNSQWWQMAVRESLCLLEFVLWGPREEEARLAAVSERRDEDVRNWLALARCRVLSQLVTSSSCLEASTPVAQETVCQARFLCSVSEMELLEVTKSLFI